MGLQGPPHHLRPSSARPPGLRSSRSQLPGGAPRFLAAATSAPTSSAAPRGSRRCSGRPSATAIRRLPHDPPRLSTGRASPEPFTSDASCRMSVDRGGLQALLDLGEACADPLGSHDNPAARSRQASPPSLPGGRGVCHAPFRARAMVWPKRLDSIGAIPTSRCEWLASWVRVIEPARPRTSSPGSDSPSSQDSDATSVEPRTTVHDGPAFPRRTARPDTPDDATRCVSSNPATDSRNRAPAGCSAPGGSHARTRPRRGASASGPVARARNLALPDLPRCQPRLALRLVVTVLRDPSPSCEGTLWPRELKGRAWYQVDRG
jgi:hypothetical protein